MEEKIRTQWENNAEAFAELIAGSGTPHHMHILNPCVEEFIGDVAGKKLLDAGCGEGYLARHYAERGAIVTAIDVSESLISRAKELTKDIRVQIDYRVADICHLDTIDDSEFDIVLSNLVLLNVTCLKEALEEFHRILRRGGCVVFSIVHPAFDFYGPGSWEMGEKNSTTGRREGRFFKMDHYFDEREYEQYWKTRQGNRFPAPISFFHRPLAVYLKSLMKAGFHLVDFEEPKPVVNDPFFERERRIPFFAVFKGIKV